MTLSLTVLTDVIVVVLFAVTMLLVHAIARRPSMRQHPPSRPRDAATQPPPLDAAAGTP